jgi:hypothetical protein
MTDPARTLVVWICLAISGCGGIAIEPGDGGAQFMVFDTDGTCGEGDYQGQGHCHTCTYRYEGGSIYISEFDVVRNVPVTLAYDTLTVRGFGTVPDVV